MGKHTNNVQEEFMVSFMEKHPQLGKNFLKGDRVEAERLWQTFAQELNKLGPPSKDCNGWKKIWSDKKSSIKKKLSINKREAPAAGGGPHNQLHISNIEESIGKICGLYDCVDGIEGSFCYGTRQEINVSDISLGVRPDCIEIENCSICRPLLNSQTNENDWIHLPWKKILEVS